MKNESLEPCEHTGSLRDAIAYWLIGKLSAAQAFLLENVVKEPVWRSFNGQVHLPRTMTDRHLYNTIKLLEREGETGTPIYRALREESDRRNVFKQMETAQRVNKQYADTDRRMAQCELVPCDYTPEGWACSHCGESYTRAYRHNATAASVALSREGLWLWYRPQQHHVTCKDPKKTLQEALEAALS